MINTLYLFSHPGLICCRANYNVLLPGQTRVTSGCIAGTSLDPTQEKCKLNKGFRDGSLLNKYERKKTYFFLFLAFKFSSASFRSVLINTKYIPKLKF